MHHKLSLQAFLVFVLLVSLFPPAARVFAHPPARSSSSVTAADLIVAMNTLRVSNGLAALKEDAIIDAVAQSTADIMAANQMSSHIGNVGGRLSAAGYGDGGKVWATENFAAASNYSIDQIMLVWSDAAHMIPAVNGAYCNVGAGVAESASGLTYYVLQAAYVAGKSCGTYTSSGGGSAAGGAAGISQIIIPVKVATPDQEGKIYHEVKAGQSFWSIAIAYKITIQDLQTWNNLSPNTPLQPGQRLFIPGSNTKGYFTPTPVGMFTTSTPDPDGKVVHTVAAYQTLSSIADAYQTSVEALVQLNHLNVGTPLQIGQALIIHPSHVTPSPTPRPLTPIEKLTPARDGKYYHIVQNGENLAWIANLYHIQLADLMRWNGLNAISILQPQQKLLLQVTPPATATATQAPATPTPPATSTATPAPATPTASPTSTAPSATTAAVSAPAQPTDPWLGIVLLLLLGGISWAVFFRRKTSQS